MYVVATKFVNALEGSYDSSPIAISRSDDGGHTWTPAKIISGSGSGCTFRSTGIGISCDEDQFAYPAIASDGPCTSTSSTSRARRSGK